MEKGRLIVFGGSAGSLEVLLHVLPSLPESFPAPVIVVVHRGSNSDHLLTDLLSSKCKLKVKEIEDKDNITPGCIFIAPGGYHLLIENDHSFSLDASEKVLHSRPCID